MDIYIQVNGVDEAKKLIRRICYDYEIANVAIFFDKQGDVIVRPVNNNTSIPKHVVLRMKENQYYMYLSFLNEIIEDLDTPTVKTTFKEYMDASHEKTKAIKLTF